MKLNRNIAFIAALLGTVAAANAQSFELRGAALVGDTFVVAPAIGGSLSVEVWYNPGSTTMAACAGYTISLGWGSANGTTTSQVGVSPLSALPAGIVSNSAPLTASVVTVKGQVASTAGSNNPFGEVSGTSGLRPYGMTFSGLQSSGSIASAVAFKVATVAMTYTLSNGDVFGDTAQECGLIVYRAGAAATTGNPTTSSGMAGNGKQGSAKYKVAAVPEPGTMAALAAGIAAMAKRRRKNS